MIFGKTKLELRVGIFVFFGIIILVAFILLIGDYTSWTSGYIVDFNFGFSNGVKVGAPVRFAGVDVGEVKEIRLVSSDQDKKTNVRIKGWVKKDARIPVDSAVWVNTLGLLGEKYIEIMPGKDYSNFVKEGDCLIGTDPIPMQEVGELAKKVVEDVDTTIEKINKGEGTVGKFISDDKVYKEIEALVTDLRKNPWKLFWKTKEKK